eukprot:Rhum_TRINITY_DN18648_c0_g1::Rhum_TRINITY_DN18648_c0_g1_i1::g.167935::m.167935
MTASPHVEHPVASVAADAAAPPPPASKTQVDSSLDAQLQAVALNEFVDAFGELASTDCCQREALGPSLEGFVLRGFLSAEECAFLRQRVGYDEDIAYANNRGQVYRRVVRQQIAHERLAEMLHARASAYLPDVYTVTDEGPSQFGPQATGAWRRTGVNASLRFCKYDAGGVFMPHYDGIYLEDVNNRSLWTIMVYLNGSFEGGATRFLDASAPDFVPEGPEPCPVLATLKPREGDCVCFPVSLYHEGQSVTAGEKYILRSDVMFQRAVPAGAGGTRQEQAKAQLAMAREYERCNRGDQAVACYRRAVKLDPDIEWMI